MNLIEFWSKLEARLSDQEGRSRWNNVRIQDITEGTEDVWKAYQKRSCKFVRQLT